MNKMTDTQHKLYTRLICAYGGDAPYPAFRGVVTRAAEYAGCTAEEAEDFFLRTPSYVGWYDINEKAANNAASARFPGSRDPRTDTYTARTVAYVPPDPEEISPEAISKPVYLGWAFMRLDSVLPRLIPGWAGAEALFDDYHIDHLTDIITIDREAGMMFGGIIYAARMHGIKAKVGVRRKPYTEIWIEVELPNKEIICPIHTECGPWGGPELRRGRYEGPFNEGGPEMRDKSDRNILRWFESYCAKNGKRRAS